MNEPEVRNPRYAGAKTVGDVVRALMRPSHPGLKQEATMPDKQREASPQKREKPS